MKISSQSDQQLVAVDRNYTMLVVAPILAVVGVVLVFAGTKSTGPALYIIGAAFILVGVVLVLLRKNETLTIDKASGVITYGLKGITGNKTLQYQVANVAKVQLTSEYHTRYTSGANNGFANRPGLNVGSGGVGFGDNSATTVQDTQVLLVMKDGTTVRVAEGSRNVSSVSLVSRVPNQDVAERIAAFLGVSFEVIGAAPPTLGGLVEGVEKMMHGNDSAPSVVEQTSVPTTPTPAPTQPAAPIAPVAPAPVPPPPNTPSSAPAPSENLNPPTQ